MTNYIYIYTGNHGKLDGVQDYFTMLKKVLGSRGFHVEASSTLRTNSTNIIVDEFTNIIENSRIAEFRNNNPNSRCVYVLTEFAERKFGVESLNNFGGLFEASLIALFNVYLRLSRNDFSSVGLRDVAALLLYSPVLATYFSQTLLKYFALRMLGKKVIDPITNFFKKNHQLIYMHMRYLGLKAHLKYADAVISSHECIIQSFDEQKPQFLGVIYPEFNKQRLLNLLMVGKKLHLEITGSVTPYRQKWITRLNSRIHLYGTQNVIGMCQAVPFSALVSKKLVDRAAFSLHPPQTRNWKYCSPMRIYRALEVDHNFPVLTKHFGQNPIEDLCLLIEDHKVLIKMAEIFYNKEALIDFVESRIESYNEIAEQRNDALAQSLKAIGPNRC